MKVQYWTLIVVVLVLTWSIWAFSCFTGPEPQLTASKFVVDLSSEYPIKLKRARLSELGSDEAIWELKRTEDSPSVRHLSFVVGVNDANAVVTPKIREGLFEVIQPSNTSTFLLKPRVTYKLEILDDGYFFPSLFATERYLRFTKPDDPQTSPTQH